MKSTTFTSLLIAAILTAVSIGCTPPDPSYCDSNTNLCWQNPQKDAYNYSDTGIVPAEAANYCEDLSLAGHNDWRLPSIDELRTIIAGNHDTMPGGDCNITAGSATTDGFNLACLGEEHYEGPGLFTGCYWKDQLLGSCDKPDPAVIGHPLETWAMNPASDDPDNWVAYISFDSGAMGYNHACSLGEVRCVRNMDGSAPASCEVNGQSCNDYYPSKAHCDQDLTSEADKLELIITVPEKLPRQPHQILAFLYEAEDFEFPPLGPPDGGTDYNQIINPNIDIDQPLTMTIPATTYYREALLNGSYRIYIGLQMLDKFPPIPEQEDYMWGKSASPISFPLNGNSEHSNATLTIEIELEPVGCPDTQAYRCGDGSCASDQSQCPVSECDPIPNDSDVLTCRYESSLTTDNCADFPKAEGWDHDSVTTFCESQPGAIADTLFVSEGNSCLIQKGGYSSSIQCATTDSDRNWFIYGMPSGICTNVMQGQNNSGPICSNY